MTVCASRMFQALGGEGCPRQLRKTRLSCDCPGLLGGPASILGNPGSARWSPAQAVVHGPVTSCCPQALSQAFLALCPPLVVGLHSETSSLSKPTSSQAHITASTSHHSHVPPRPPVRFFSARTCSGSHLPALTGSQKASQGPSSPPAGGPRCWVPVPQDCVSLAFTFSSLERAGHGHSLSVSTCLLQSTRPLSHLALLDSTGGSAERVSPSSHEKTRLGKKTVSRSVGWSQGWTGHPQEARRTPGGCVLPWSWAQRPLPVEVE